ncbi:Platelet-activating factor acetylhydrolase 2, cytoplasmic [Varanus komodoensis]|uniref:Platelet-activating factor acetylhydrolase n=1 Tax=Varanus komodoensis TaxID=61221 RepID=A0A8D2KU50_VARKO|nr:platelet-activating factor acetylhydrolase 2, cytoplasmic [Varanus komodoensis]KAF7242502.1 Platelet-activating factor acetylhydrolase 2, cytoplasmic [Varanus komodoensis]
MGVTQSLELPHGTGSYPVGCTDVMVGQTQKGLFFRLFYPCTPCDGAEQPSWIPRYEYYCGLADYMNMNRRWCAPLLSVTFGSCKIPVSWDAPFRLSSHKYPLIIFSHGLGAFRTVYSAVCIEMASRGFLVMALEHRDHSASATYFCKLNPEAPDFPEAQVQEQWLTYRGAPKEKEFRFRNPQLHQRANECIRGLKLIRSINNGKAVANLLQTDFDLSVLKDNVDLTKAAVMGHSFGGATSILALVKEAQFKCAVALDAWMFPLENSLYPKVTKPVLFVNTEAFQTAESVAKMKKIATTSSETKIITILGTVHQSQTDFTFLAGNLVNKVFKTRGTIDPYKGLNLTNQAALAFLQKHLQLKEDFDKWDELLEGVGDAVVPDSPLQRSSL